MKKTLLFAVMAGAALAGCVKNEEIAKSDGSPERISFDAPVVGIPTRATEIYGNYPGNKDFAVWALYHQNLYDATAFNSPVYYMKDVTCTADNTTNPTSWAPATDYYWPKNGYLTFAAYAPSEVSATWGVNGFEFTDFTVNSDPTKQIDLLYSERQYDKQSANVVSDKPYDGITIPFKHALSSIVFTAQTTGISDNSSTVVKITSIQVYNVVKKGTFKQNLLAEKTGDNDDSKPAWTIDASVPANVQNVYTVYSSTEGKEVTSAGVYVNGDPDEVGDDYGTTADNEIPIDPEKKNNGIRRSDLIVIPQNLDRDGNTNDVTVTIAYSIKNGNADAVTQTQSFQLAVADTDADTDADPTYVWEMGKRYIYHISIGLNKIYFNPQVTNWDNEVGQLDIL